jgi:thioesterase domain-containing protein
MSRRPDGPHRGAPALLSTVRPARGPERLRVYGVHPGGLAATAWSGLADLLPDDVGLSVLDLQSVPEYFAAALTGGTPDITLPELAACAGDALRADRPDGLPFVLVGWSFGGVVAYEISRSLAPARLILLDSIAPTDDFKRADDLLDPPLLIRWFAMYLAAKRGRPLAAEPGIDAPTTEAGLATVLATASASGVLPDGTEPAGLRKLYDSYVAGLRRNNHLVLPYAPPASDQPIVLVKPARGLLPEYDDLGWRELAPVTVVPAPGDHYSILFDPSAWAVVADQVSTPPASAAA